MSVLWLREKLLKHLKDRKEALTDTILAGVKDLSQYEYLRGQYSALVQVENELRELLEKVIEDDGEKSSSP